MQKIKVELIENFLVVWDSKEGSELYKTAYYGKPVGIPKPKTPEFDVPLILDLMEDSTLQKLNGSKFMRTQTKPQLT